MKNYINDIKKEFTFKKAVIILILLSCIGFIFISKNDLRFNKTYLLNGDKPKSFAKKEINKYKQDRSLLKNCKDDNLLLRMNTASDKNHPLKGNMTVSQTFIAKEPLLKYLHIFFENPKTGNARGKLEVSILDSKDKVICHSSINASLIRNKQATTFDFVNKNSKANINKVIRSRKVTKKNVDGIEMNKGAFYKIKIATKNLNPKDKIKISFANSSYGKFAGSLDIDGASLPKTSLQMSMEYHKTPVLLFVIMILGLLLSLIFVLLPLKKYDLNIKLSRIMFFATPFVCFWIIYKISGRGLAGTASMLITLNGILNLLIILMIWWVIYAITNRIKYTIILSTLITFVFAIANYFMQLFRNAPLIANDIFSIGTAMDVTETLSIQFSKSSIWIIVISTIWICLAIYLTSYKSLDFKPRIASICVATLLAGAFYGTFFVSPFLKKNNMYVSGFYPTWSYDKLGYYLGFTISMTTAKIKKPKDYSPCDAQKIANRYAPDTGKKCGPVSKKHPNIIVVMNEAYSDLSVLGTLKTTAPYMPFFNILKKNTVKGIMHTSVFGGSTADTEMEFLTGNSMAFMPFHSIPYNDKFPVKSPSMATTLKSQGYGGHIAFHPGISDSYNRNKVYPNIGFNKSIFLEDLKHPKTLRAYVSDEGNFDVINDEYEKYRKTGNKSPFFMFNVTIQNHSDFTFASGIVKKRLDVMDSALGFEQTVQYLNLVKETDIALEKFINHYKKVKEPTVIVMFGDHQPRVDSAFYAMMNSRNKKDSAIVKAEKQYRVPFMIWANYDIKAEKNVDISANYLGAYLLNKIGARLTGYDKFLLDMRKHVPVITAIGYIGKNGKMYKSNQESKYSKYINMYNTLQYNYFADDKKRVKNFFYLK